MPSQNEEVLAERTLTLPAERTGLAELVDAVEAFGLDARSGYREAWHEFLTAVAEIGANILLYAYQNREPGEVELTLLRFPARLEARFRDCGAPFTEQPIAAPPEELDSLDAILSLDERGRGLAVARAALSSIDYERTPAGENHWRLVKHLPETE